MNMDSSIQPISGATASLTASQVSIAMLKKANDQAKQEGQSMVQMLQEAPNSSPKPYGSLGHRLDVQA
ncbi:MAG: putative motility protein [Pseudomonadota bacterium]